MIKIIHLKDVKKYHQIYARFKDEVLIKEAKIKSKNGFVFDEDNEYSFYNLIMNDEKLIISDDNAALLIVDVKACDLYIKAEGKENEFNNNPEDDFYNQQKINKLLIDEIIKLKGKNNEKV